MNKAHAGLAVCSRARRRVPRARRIGLAFGLRKFYRAGDADGHRPGGRLLRVHLQPQTPGVLAAVDRRLGALCSALYGARAGAVGSFYVHTNGFGPLAVRPGGFVFFPRRAILRPGQTVGGRGPFAGALFGFSDLPTLAPPFSILIFMTGSAARLGMSRPRSAA